MSQPSVVLDHHPSYVLQLNMQAIDLTDTQFDRLCRDNPDLRLELTMEEYIANGAQLGWLLDPHTSQVYIYRPQSSVEVLEAPPTLSGEPVLPGFVFHSHEIW